jgi:hypothetical protein
MSKLIAMKRRYEVWAKWDKSAQVYELFTESECESYIGCADNLADAETFALDWINERVSA